MTLEECYQWHIDEHIVNTGMVNESKYFIDLGEGHYNHSIKFNTPASWDTNAYVLDVTTGTETMYHEQIFEFEGVKGHLYEIYNKG